MPRLSGDRGEGFIIRFFRRRNGFFMGRRAARELVLHLIFQHDYTGQDAQEILRARVTPQAFGELEGEYSLYRELPEPEQNEYIIRAVRGVIQQLGELDSYIEKYAVGWNFSRITRVSKCLMRLSMYELLYMDIPMKVSLNEALELAKKYDSEEAAQFINGIMGSFIKHEINNEP